MSGRGSGGRGSLLSTLGLFTLAIVAIAIAAVVVITVSNSSDSIFDLRVGDCFVLGDEVDTTLDSVDTVDCAEPHDAEVVGVGQLNAEQDQPYPTDDALFTEIDERCRGTIESGDYGLLPVAPDEASWEPLGGRYLCVAVPYGGALVSGSIGDG